MARYVALLRGINVGRNRRIGMADLRSALEDRGYDGVKTLGQSGNIVLDATSDDVIARDVSAAAGMELDVVVRTPRQLAAVVKRDPLGSIVTDPRFYLVHFLSGRPDAAAVRALRSADVGDEVFAVHGRELYTWHPGGQQDSALAKLVSQTDFGVTVTNRNWNTVTKLLALARD